jgi:peptide deformylase
MLTNQIFSIQPGTLKDITPEIIALVSDMIETMHHFPHCVGIAAPQVGKSLRIIIVDVSLHSKPHPNHGQLAVINPVIVSANGKRKGREGCLSIPDLTANVVRNDTIAMEGISPKGKLLHIETSGYEAVALQHEIDHLNGILFLDRVSSLKKDVFQR